MPKTCIASFPLWTDRTNTVTKPKYHHSIMCLRYTHFGISSFDIQSLVQSDESELSKRPHSLHEPRDEVSVLQATGIRRLHGNDLSAIYKLPHIGKDKIMAVTAVYVALSEPTSPHKRVTKASGILLGINLCVCVCVCVCVCRYINTEKIFC